MEALPSQLCTPTLLFRLAMHSDSSGRWCLVMSLARPGSHQAGHTEPALHQMHLKACQSLVVVGISQLAVCDASCSLRCGGLKYGNHAQTDLHTLSTDDSAGSKLTTPLEA